MPQIAWLIIFVVIIVLLVMLFVFTRYFRLWIQCFTTKAGIGFFDLIGMDLRKVNADLIVRARIMAVQSNIKISRRELESHYLAGGNVPNVVRALISASRADIPMDFKRASAIDLAGRNVEEAVQTSVNPKIIDVPDPAKGKTTIDAVARDGIQLKARARVTVRTNLDQLIGGATEDTIIARVGEGIVTTIGSANTYMDVLDHPERISERVLNSGLDAGTAFEILSIDIADIEVGENVGARLQADQAEADTRRAQAHAEIRRAKAVAREEEMKATVVENRAKVVLAEADVPMAIAKAFRNGQFNLIGKPNPVDGDGADQPT
ncbi:SigmaW regulon antibacterial [Planctomycetes bacterium Pan216]|uniref:Flotillin-like protein FloA n=1 Tax=Kolteria novifilia TaxID=2527975 RepID=A0A518B1J0_9BACT|nr:SigmaW regulon antibacterial [Planctomycetes bacterium Pan216]